MTGQNQLKFTIKFKSLLLHTFLCAIIFVIPVYFVFIPVIVGLLIYFFFTDNKVNVIVLGFYALCCKSEAVFYPYSAVLLFLVIIDKRKFNFSADSKKITKRFYTVFAYTIVLYILQFAMDNSPLSLPFYMLTFFSPVVIFFYILKVGMDQTEVKKVVNQLLMFAMVQCVIGFVLEALPVGISTILARSIMGDHVTGTTNASNQFGFIILAAGLPFFYGVINSKKWITKNAILIGMAVIFILVMIILSDAKSRLAAFILAGGSVFVIRGIFMIPRVQMRIFAITVFSIFLILIFPFVVQTYIRILTNYDDYINGKNNAKTQMYTVCFSPDTRPLAQYFIGTGAGTNGSRAANALAYDALFKSDKYSVQLPSFIPAHSSQFTRRYITRIYTPQYATTTQYRSAILGDPFNSICALFVELGVIGFFLFFRFLFSIFITLLKYKGFFNSTALTIFIANFIIATLDQGYEIPIMMFLMYMFIGFELLLGTELLERKKRVFTRLKLESNIA